MQEHDVRVAAFDDLDSRTAYSLWQLREAVFVVEQECAYAELDGRDLEAGTRHIWVADDGRPVAYLRLLEDPDGFRIGRVLVAASHRGRGLAEVLMRRALGLVGDRPSRLDAQSYLAQWYTRFGYAVTGPEFLDDGIPHVPMSRPAQSVRTRP
ncbi:MAG TPA: GNAT family N-acetyltransferase [Nocardioides sp.]|uniref:GNAT family N-acetyltransferase n=1 Tax=Nocardioides sp. TaxID=35761 RepID=UPI002D80D393|nr:GNAT family N-acetyltransferase [Nocardioides sp.]HET6651757.1 GNAT family N-acetyltransferase [Nocardioides sp.]